MREKLFKELQTNIDKLIVIVKKVDSQSLLSRIACDLTYTGKSIFEKAGLSSPFRQRFYLLGLMVSNPGSESKKLDDKTWKEICKLLENIYFQYTLMFWPTKEKYKSLSPEWWQARKVSMPVFLDYFNTSVLAYDEQLVERIRTWFCPFDPTICGVTGLRANDSLKVYAWLREKIQGQLDTSSEVVKEEKKLRSSFCDQWRKEGWSLSEARKRAQNHPVRAAVLKLRNSLDSLFCITKEEMCNKFDRTLVKNLWKHFVSDRTPKDFRFITEENPAESKPLFAIGPNKFFCPCVSQFLRAAFGFLLKTMKNSDSRNFFFKHRDKDTVEKATGIFSNYFGNDSSILKSVFEGPNSQNEHDIIVLYKRNLLIIEVKATPHKEPFRDPDKAFIRIKRDFKSAKGIQKAYDQTLSLKRYILNSDPAVLYDENRKVLLKLSQKDFDKIYSICLTADRYGIIAVNLSLLLDKPGTEPFPWSCDLYTLEVLLDGFKNRKSSPDFFLRYLDERTRFHKKLFTSDELEIAGFYLKYGSFNKLEEKQAGKLIFTPDTSDIFDDIYFKKHGSSYLPYKEESGPSIIDVREEIQKMISNDKVIDP